MGGRDAFFAGCERAVRAVAVRIRYGPSLARAWLRRPLDALRLGSRARPEAGARAVVPYGRPESLSRFMDYGPDWPPVPRRRRVRHPLLRRCLAVVVVYAVIWALGAVLLELRLYQLGDAGGAPVTTYTTVSPRR